MARILILGNDPNAFWCGTIEGAEFSEVPRLTSNNEPALSDYIERTVTPEVEQLVIDACSIDTDLALSIALDVRLMLHALKKGALCNMTIVSDFGLDSLTGRGLESMLLMTGNIQVCAPENVLLAINNSTPMSAAEYVSDFLNLIKIQPQEKMEGRHSIANEWGAEILGKTINGGVNSESTAVRVTSSRYFKYSSIASLDAEDVATIATNKTSRFLMDKITVDKTFNYLLIDDEASKGWENVLAKLMPKAHGKVFSQKAHDYGDLPSELRDEIEAGKFTVIFLDLRMAGVEEDKVLQPADFSGMKILRTIKQHNPGTQVVMLTATNKSWNVKALLDAGADGYYMKESPEYHFSLKYSAANTRSLCETIETCVQHAPLQEIYSEIMALTLPSDLDITEDIYGQLKLSFYLMKKATTDDEVAFAYIALEQVFEIVTSAMIEVVKKGFGYECVFRDDKTTCKSYQNATANGLLSGTTDKFPQWKKVAAVYYQLFDGGDNSFDGKAKDAINIRNNYMHPSSLEKEKIDFDQYQDLFDVIKQFLSVIK